MPNTNWSTPKTNIIAALLDLRNALQAGQHAVLIKAYNEDCSHPIRARHFDTDFRNYESYIGHSSSADIIKADKSMTEFEKHLSLNYISCFGTPEAIQKYYETGEVSADNFKDVGRNHLVNVDDHIKWLETKKDYQLVNMYKRQYRAPEHAGHTQYSYNFFRLKDRSAEYSVKKFNRKLWVVELLDKDAKANIPVGVKILNVVMTPLKYVPKKSVLRMDTYKVVTFSVGGVYHGYSVDFHLPKKFSFK